MSKYIDEHINEYTNKYIFPDNDKFVYAFVLNEIKEKDPDKVVEINIESKGIKKTNPEPALDVYNGLMNNPNIEAFNLGYLPSRSENGTDRISISALVLDGKTQTTFKLLKDKPEAIFEVLTKIKLDK